MKKVIILSVLFVFSCSLFSCTADDIPADNIVNATESGPVGGQGSTPGTPVTPPKP